MVIADPAIGLNGEHPMAIQAQVATAKAAPSLTDVEKNEI